MSYLLKNLCFLCFKEIETSGKLKRCIFYLLTCLHELSLKKMSLYIENSKREPLTKSSPGLGLATMGLEYISEYRGLSFLISEREVFVIGFRGDDGKAACALRCISTPLSAIVFNSRISK